MCCRDFFKGLPPPLFSRLSPPHPTSPPSLEELSNEGRGIETSLNVKDWSKAEDHYKALYQKLDRYKKEFSSPPAVMVKTLLDLDAKIQEAWPTRKKLNKLASKALSKLRSNLQKDAAAVAIGIQSLGAARARQNSSRWVRC